MAYSYPGQETHWWTQQFPVIYATGQFQASSPQDEYWPLPEFSATLQEQKNLNVHPQLNIMSGNLLMPTPIQEVHSPYEYDRCVRYVSPTTSHHSSSFSESSASTEHILTPNTMSRSTPCIPNSTVFAGQHAFRIPDLPVQQHAIWQPQAQTSYPVFPTQSSFSTFIPSQPSLPLSEVEMMQHDEEINLDLVHDGVVNSVQSKSPVLMPQPQELELSEEPDDSSMSTVTDSIVVNTPTEHSSQTRVSESEVEEEEEDPIALDHDSDSDYDNRPSRRRNSRSTPRQKHSRKSSNSTIISQNSRVHKRTTSSSSMTSTTSNSFSRSQARSSSKNFKIKSKGPTFLNTKLAATVPKSDRLYPCTFHRFGCTAEFPNKNEWKRHVACQHLQLGYYRCDLDACNPDSSSASASTSRHGRRANAHTLARSRSRSHDNSSNTDEIVKYYNDFNRKDLFTQHCRRMHGPSRNPTLCSKPPSKKTGQLCPTKEDDAAFEAQLTEIRARCWHVRRHAPSRSSCGFCKKVFDADYYDSSSSASTSGSHSKEMEGNAEEKAWEERMEHVGRHYEKEGVSRDDEEIDEDLVEWGLRTDVLRSLPDGRFWLVSADDPIGEGQSNENVNGVGAGATSGRRGSGSSKASIGREADGQRKKARRQPSRTAVRVSFKEEDDVDDTTGVMDAI